MLLPTRSKGFTAAGSLDVHEKVFSAFELLTLALVAYCDVSLFLQVKLTIELCPTCFERESSAQVRIIILLLWRYLLSECWLPATLYG